MTIYFDNDDRRVRYVVTDVAGQTEFNIDFPLSVPSGGSDGDYLTVYVDGAEVTTGFTVDADALTVTFDSAVAQNSIVTIEGSRDAELINEFPLRGELRSGKMNAEFVGILQLLQELKRDAARTILLNPAEADSASALMPLLSASKALITNANGDGFELTSFADILSEITATITALDDDDFLVGAGGVFIDRTPAQVRTILGLGAAALLAITGADTTVVSGTAGTDGNLAKWNGDGDLVDSGSAVADFATAAQGALADSAVQPGDMLDVASAGAFYGEVLVVINEQAAGVFGDTSTATGWDNLTLNTVVVNNITGASLASNAIALPDGDYVAEITMFCNAGTTATYKSVGRLYDTTNTAELVKASAGRSYGGGNHAMVGADIFTISGGGASLKLQGYTSNSGVFYGSSANLASQNERYQMVKIWKVG